MTQYADVTHYVMVARLELQDEIAPYRYPDLMLVRALNHAMSILSRLRPDILLDLKYQRPLRKGDLGDGVPMGYAVTDIGFDNTGNYAEGTGTLVPVPSMYVAPLEYFINGWIQLVDVTDTQDQRAQGFLAKFQTQLMTLSGA